MAAGVSCFSPEALWILADHPFQPHLGAIHLSRPSQAPLPPDELWNVYYAFAGVRWGVGGGGLSDGHQRMFEYRVRVPNANTTKQYYFIILGEI